LAVTLLLILQRYKGRFINVRFWYGFKVGRERVSYLCGCRYSSAIYREQRDVGWQFPQSCHYLSHTTLEAV
jgi:hypothetical protein